MAPLPYYCIHCGQEVQQVYKTYAEGNLIKLLKCERCNNLIDPYCEYDTSLISINVVLQKKKAYRHILLNTWFENYWKLGVMFLFSEAYCNWCFQKGMEVKADHPDFYELEANFYKVLVRTILCTCAFDVCVLSLAKLFYIVRDKEPPSSFSNMTLWKGLCLSRYAVLLEFIPLIWSFADARFRMLIVMGIFISSNMQSLQVVAGVSALTSFVVVFTGCILRQLVISSYDTWVPLT